MIKRRKIMDPQINQNDNQDAARSQYYDPFPEPQTIPAGWDTSAILSAPKTAPVIQAEDKAEN